MMSIVQDRIPVPSPDRTTVRSPVRTRRLLHPRTTARSPARTRRLRRLMDRIMLRRLITARITIRRRRLVTTALLCMPCLRGVGSTAGGASSYTAVAGFCACPLRKLAAGAIVPAGPAFN